MPETKRFEIRHEEVERLHARIGGALDMVRRALSEFPGRILLISGAVAAWGFAIGPATVLAASYLQKTLHYAPWQASALMIPGGLLALWLNILMGQLSDHIGRKRVLFLMMAVCGAAYVVFFSGVRGWIVPVFWITAFFGFFSAEALFRSLAAEIVPTAYRATVGGLCYTAELMAGGVSLGLEGLWYDRFHAHGPAIAVSLAAIPFSLIALVFLPEPAGRTLEDISRA